MNYTAEQIEEAFKKMPEELKKAISILKVGQIMETLGKRHGLHIDKIAEMGGYVHLVLVGLLPASDLPNYLKSSLSLPAEDMNELIQEINDLILGPVRNKFMELQKLSTEVEPAEEETTPVATLSAVPPKVAEAIKPDQINPIVKSQDEMLKTSGVEVLGTTPTPSTPAVNIAAQKLSTSFSMPKEETDLSVIKIPAPVITPAPVAPAMPKIDPYKEKV